MFVNTADLYPFCISGWSENTMRGEKIREAGVRRGRKNLKRADLGQDPDLEKGEEKGLGQETAGKETTIETGTEIKAAEETEIDLPGGTEAQESTDLIPHKGLSNKFQI